MANGNPQVEDGYTRIANELFEAMMRAPLIGAEHRVLMGIIRLTYGYNRKVDAISVSQIMGATGVPRRTVIRAMHNLIRKNIITSVSRPGQPALVGVQKRYQDWQFDNAESDQNTTTEDATPATDGTSATPDTSATDGIGTSATDGTPTHATRGTHQRQRKTVKTEQREGRKRPAPPMHPALAAYREATHLNVSLDWQQDVIDAVGDAEEDVAFWRQVIKDYTGTYTNKANVKAMLDYYKRRELPGTGKRNRTSTTTGIPALDPPIYLDVADSGFAHGEIQRIQEERRRAAEAATCAP